VLSAANRISAKGFTLVELMVGLVVIAILMSLAVPSFQTWIQNSQIRNAAESVLNGLQIARAEAVSRNANVEFVMGTGTSWLVQLVDGTNIDSRASDDGSSNTTTATISPAASTTITFNSFGGVETTNKDTTNPITQIDFDVDKAVLPDADSQNLRVTIGIGGSARMCDPNAPVTSPRAC